MLICNLYKFNVEIGLKHTYLIAIVIPDICTCVLFFKFQIVNSNFLAFYISFSLPRNEKLDVMLRKFCNIV